MESVCVNRQGASPSLSDSDSRKAKSVHLSVFDTVLCCAVVLQAWPNWPFRIGNNSRQEGKRSLVQQLRLVHRERCFGCIYEQTHI